MGVLELELLMALPMDINVHDFQAYNCQTIANLGFMAARGEYEEEEGEEGEEGGEEEEEEDDEERPRMKNRIRILTTQGKFRTSPQESRFGHKRRQPVLPCGVLRAWRDADSPLARR